LFEVLLETDHQHFIAKRAGWLERFIGIMVKNSGAYLWTEVVFEFLFKVMGRNQFVREWFYNNAAKWQQIRDWTREYTHAPQPGHTGTNGVRLYKGRANVSQYGMNNLSENSGKRALSAAFRAKKMKDLIQKNIPDTSNEPNLDSIDLQDFKFVPGDKVSLYHRKRDTCDNWMVATVLDEMLCLHSLVLDHNGKTSIKW